jgi:hypothetical protein
MAAITSLDAIVNNVLMRRGYSKHWYIQFLVFAKDALRELVFDDLKIINTKLLSVNDYNAVDLPSDFLDYTKVGVKSGQFVTPLLPQDSINSLNNFDSDFNITRYDEQSDDSDEEQLYYGAIQGLRWGVVTVNDFGESIGRQYGGTGQQWDTFKIIRERNQIQLNEALDTDTIVLEYISDGMNADAASQITPYAISTIEAYILFQMKANNRNYSPSEVELAERKYINERRILRARENPITIEVLKRIVQKNTKSSIK